MTLKQKFKQWLDKQPRLQIREVQLEVIAEKFAIEFAQWLVIRYNEDVIYDEYTTEELLEIYKQEKEL